MSETNSVQSAKRYNYKRMAHPSTCVPSFFSASCLNLRFFSAWTLRSASSAFFLALSSSSFFLQWMDGFREGGREGGRKISDGHFCLKSKNQKLLLSVRNFFRIRLFNCLRGTGRTYANGDACSSYGIELRQTRDDSGGHTI